MKIFKQKFILDESGSMNDQRATVISGFNEQLDSMRQEEIRDGISYLVSLVKFNESVTVLYQDLPLNKVPKLTEETYMPSGWTALYDAIGAAIDTAKLGETDTFVTIFTDGKENKSRKWKKAGIKTLIDIRQNENKWGFVFFGANQDAWEEASSINIANALTYTANNTGSAISATSMCRSAYVTTATSGVYNVSNLTCNVNKDDLVK
jgi:hypothetical protein